MAKQTGEYPKHFGACVIQRFMDEKEFEAFYQEYNAYKQTLRKGWIPEPEDQLLFNKGATLEEWMKHWETNRNTAILRIGKIVLWKEEKKREKIKR
jgi:hypothetical protein